ncbi:MAG TPA: sigma-70 family RNA polymerase sigma factor, partial [Phycisphaerales bacterium]|nr:sigma-70 family RNA polymerase sigma factor [Phycisphaerales bacterium]
LVEAAEGCQLAWRTLVGRYARRVYALAKSRCGNHDLAEEVTQSVFVTVATKLTSQGAEPGYTEQGRFESWLFRIAMNRLRDELRRRKRTAGGSGPGPAADIAPDPGAVPARADDAADQLNALRRALAQLAEADREVVELRHHAGLSFKQIAELLEEPMGTLLARHHRALKKLKDLLDPLHPTLPPGAAS